MIVITDFIVKSYARALNTWKNKTYNNNACIMSEHIELRKEGGQQVYSTHYCYDDGIHINKTKIKPRFLKFYVSAFTHDEHFGIFLWHLF